MSLIGEGRRNTQVPTLHLQSFPSLAHRPRILAFPGWVLQIACIMQRGGSHAGRVISKQSVKEESEPDVRHGSEYFVLPHHLAQQFGTGDVHRRLAILSVHQAGELIQLLQHVTLEVSVHTELYERFVKPGVLL